ncbi:MAG TPA: KamA family radical SAM protein [Bdellovibrionales bacterium]|nr:KamA family radical SAM protein [Bdellovibrionales bacterium]
MKIEFRKIEPTPHAHEWSSWAWQFKNGLTRAEDFAPYFELTSSEREAFARGTGFQVRATPYYAALADRTIAADPIRRMILPTARELEGVGQQVSDPLGERRHSPRERLIHRYPDRVLFLVTDQCALYCRYCLRKHFTGQERAFVGSKDYEAALVYLRGATGVREVILSGGDPLSLGDARLERVLSDLRAIEHIELIRVGSRMPVVCPMRVTAELVSLFKKYKPVYFMTHFNHPRELSHDGAVALERLVDNGVPVFNQLVLLNGINNHPAIVQALSRRLLFLRVKPYYMFQCDPSEGSEHFRTSVDESLAIQRELWGRLSGLAMPNLSLDIPGGGGKVGLVPNFETARAENARTFIGWDGRPGVYENPARASIVPDITDYEEEWRTLKSQSYGTGNPES